MAPQAPPISEQEKLEGDQRKWPVETQHVSFKKPGWKKSMSLGRLPYNGRRQRHAVLAFFPPHHTASNHEDKWHQPRQKSQKAPNRTTRALMNWALQRHELRTG